MLEVERYNSKYKIKLHIITTIVFPNYVQDNINFLPFFFKIRFIAMKRAGERGKKVNENFGNRAFLDETLPLYETFFSLFQPIG